MGSGPAHIYTKKHRSQDGKNDRNIKKLNNNNLCRDRIYVKASQ